jgi:dehydrogenase/reductase SDR family protein 12
VIDPRLIVDDLLEISIVGSFSRPGYLARRRLFDWADPTPGALIGRTALVTGPTSGLGRAATEALAALGARVVLVGGSEERLGRVRKELVGLHGEDRFPTVVADMSSLRSVDGAVLQIVETEPRLDILVDNAGAINSLRTETEDGLEATFATMVAGPFSLISGLLPLLDADRGGRVISVVSGGMYAQKLPLDDLQFEAGEYNGTIAYARAKRAAVTVTREWARRQRGGSVRFNAMHPGWADTPGLAKSLPGFYSLMGPVLRTPQEAADTITWLATDADAGMPGGRLFLDRRSRPFDRLPSTRLSGAQRRQLWDDVAALAAQT